MLPKIWLPERGPLLLVVVVILSLLIAACGVDDSASPAQPAATAAPATEETTAPEPTEAATTAPEPTEAATTAPEPTEAATTAPEPTETATTAPEPTETATPQPTATETSAAPEPTATAQPTAAPAATETPATTKPTTMPDPTATPPAPRDPCEGERGGEVGNCAPELAGTQEWVNSDPFTLESQLGKVVLIDFWTYSCINCIRTLPFLQTWNERYADEGLVILGVHTPEFEFEKVYDNVVDATVDMGVAWPVVQDNDFAVWSSFANRFWPAKYLIDKDGVIRYRHFGEGKYAETEEEIRKLLAEVGAEADALAEPLPEDQQQRDSAFLLESGGKVTPELFAGWRFTAVQQRGGIGQAETYGKAYQASYRRGDQSSEVAEFEAPREVRVDHIYFQGPWAVGPENVRHARVTEDAEDDFILLAYSARSVNAVLTSESGEPYRVIVKVNNEYLTEENKGEDVLIGDVGESYVLVDSPRAYYLVEHPTWVQDQYIQLFSESEDFGLFSFTFGTYEDGF